MEKKQKEKLTIAILGRSGCGKGTQARQLIKRLKKRGVIHISTGALLRDLMHDSTPTGHITRTIMERGRLHPSWIAAYTWLKIIIEGNGAARDLVFDGAPRRVWEVKLLDEVMKWHGRPLPLCLYIDVSRKEAMRRLLARKRADDTVAAIKSRLDYFPKEVVPALKYYKREGRLITINGAQSPEKVWKEIDEAFAKYLGTQWPRALQ
mgnify:FL=1